MISKFLTEMSLSNERLSTMYALAASASSSRPIISIVSRLSTGVMRSVPAYQSCGARLSGFSSSWPQAYRLYPFHAWRNS
ncbi:MAG: hypothetical protein AUG09_01425 [Acidobacteria bacterium 13_1_20CM_2_68_7]|nr:MAG: hypothetical protein AUG09_01425 [Acidobacteria bacterium 13_1_20CM_2_68_7]